MGRRIKGHGEQVVHTTAREQYFWAHRAGATAWVKRQARRRERREGLVEIEQRRVGQ